MLFLIASFISASLHLRSSLSLSLCTLCTAAYGVQLSVEQRQHITDPISLFTALHIAYPMLSAGRLLHGTFHVQWIRMKRRRVISKYTKKKMLNAAAAATRLQYPEMHLSVSEEHMQAYLWLFMWHKSRQNLPMPCKQTKPKIVLKDSGFSAQSKHSAEGHTDICSLTNRSESMFREMK